MLYQKLPSTEKVWEQISIKEGVDPEYFVTADKRRESYKLWHKKKGGYELIKKARTPDLLRIGKYTG